jgi:hypothetical protein
MLKNVKSQSGSFAAKTKTKPAILVLLACLLPLFSSAQCAMCRAVLETEDGGQKGEAVNDGIVYLMVFPYLLVGIVAYVIYRMKTKKPIEE